MCKAISPAAFLAVAFKKTNKDCIESRLLLHLKDQVNATTANDGERLGVRWNHETLDCDMNFYSSFFKMESDGIRCNNLEELNAHFDELTAEIDEMVLKCMEYNMSADV